MMTLHWTSWAAELGAIRAPSVNGNHYIVRPGGGWHALFAGGLHMGDFAKRAEAKRAAPPLGPLGRGRLTGPRGLSHTARMRLAR